MVWQEIKKIININKRSPQKPQNISNNGKLMTSYKNIANTFSNFFLLIYQNKYTIIW